MKTVFNDPLTALLKGRFNVSSIDLSDFFFKLKEMTIYISLREIDVSAHGLFVWWLVHAQQLSLFGQS